MSGQSGEINIDRFSGEANEPPVCGHCSYCGSPIFEGYPYSVDEGMIICGGCEREHAYEKFKERAEVRIAQREVVDYD